MQKITLFILSTFFVGMIACNPKPKEEVKKDPTKEQTEEKETKEDNLLSKNGITLVPVASPKFDNAALSLKQPAENATEKSGKVKFDFEVENYDLGNQTPDADQKMCANSAKGQHIHLILNNEPYSAHYEADFEKELADGHYVGLAFLSRSYHESIKQKSAYVLTQFDVGKAEESAKADLTAPHLFYSRPKGQYVGEKNIKKVMLDFYLANTTLSPDGNKVKATINGTAFLLDSWQPYFMEGLPEGELTVKLELIDKDGQPIAGPFNTVERKVKLFKEEPLIEK